MKIKPLFFAAIGLGVLTAVAWWTSRPTPLEPSPLIGEKILPPEILRQTRRLEFYRIPGKPSLIIQQNPQGFWRLSSYFHLPVDPPKLSRWMNQLQEARIKQLVTKDPSRFEQLGLGERRLELFDVQGKMIWSLEIGKKGPSKELFVRLDDAPEAYLLDQEIKWDLHQSNWIDLDPFDDLQPDAIKEIEWTFPSSSPPKQEKHPLKKSPEPTERLTLKRSRPQEPFTSPNLGPNLIFDQKKITTFLNAFLQAQFTHAVSIHHPEVQAALKQTKYRLHLKTFAGELLVMKLALPPASSIKRKELGLSQIPSPKVYLTLSSSNPTNPWYQAEDRVVLVFSLPLLSWFPPSPEAWAIPQKPGESKKES